MANEIKTRKVSSKASREALYVVTDGGREIGLLAKYPNTRTETHPWKAFAGIGMAARFLGSFYDAEGGRAAALAAVLAG